MSNITQTLVIFSNFEELPMFFLVEGDKTHLDGVITNNTEDYDKADELNVLIYKKDGSKETGYYNHEPLTLDQVQISFELDYVGAIINCGFAP